MPSVRQLCLHITLKLKPTIATPAKAAMALGVKNRIPPEGSVSPLRNLLVALLTSASMGCIVAQGSTIFKLVVVTFLDVVCWQHVISSSAAH
jgi:hypothetical protein